MKPNTRTAMQLLIDEVKSAIPFDTAEADLCADSESCTGCSLKLLEFLSTELDDWQYKLDNQETPNFGDLQRLSKSSKKIYNILKMNGLIKP
ncbi:MAG: hypothetical protein ISR69_10905 [Gammaproteobacteria bacterium]|nr:hypothetical protein [Gammaproteobacteria bacterium]